MDNYIHEVIRLIHQSWPGLLSAMDVVNEAIDDNTGTVRTTGNEWYTTFGDSTYVMKAFELTRKYTAQYGETQLKLYYNDYNTNIAIKVDGIVRLLTPIFQAGLLDGIGMQEHDANNSPSAADWITSYNKFYPVCSEMSVTELDVTTGSGSPSASVLATQADQYGMLFKCFVERSYKSGRGKIINVSKDGLNDANTFKTNQSSSLWDAQDQCKPSFFAAANVGINYNALDSLILYSDSLKQIEYTTTSWTNFAAALVAANTAKDQNYSATVSADTALGLAKNNLKTAINGLVKIDTLPVELTAFTGFYNGSEVLLNWTTKTEINNRGFEIQTEINGTWVVIGFINGKGTSTAPSQYSFRDATENGTSTVYRLKMVDFNGSYKYSESITVIIIVKFSLSQNYPNPFNPSTQIKYSVPLSGFVSLKVYNLLGEEVATLFEGVRNIGNYTATFDGTKLASGVYVYQLHANNFTDTKKLLLLK
jgi:hypothetical protein